MFSETKNYILIVLCFFSWSSCLAQKENSERDLSPEAFKATIENSPQAIVLDVRTPDELTRGVIPNAVNIDYFKKDFENEIGKLDKNKTYFLYCAEGGRSSETKELMTRLGFKDVYNLKDGFTAWKKKKTSDSKITPIT